MRLNHGFALYLKHAKPSLRMIMKRIRIIILHNDCHRLQTEVSALPIYKYKTTIKANESSPSVLLCVFVLVDLVNSLSFFLGIMLLV